MLDSLTLDARKHFAEYKRKGRTDKHHVVSVTKVLFIFLLQRNYTAWKLKYILHIKFISFLTFIILNILTFVEKRIREIEFLMRVHCKKSSILIFYAKYIYNITGWWKNLKKFSRNVLANKIIFQTSCHSWHTALQPQTALHRDRLIVFIDSCRYFPRRCAHGVTGCRTLNAPWRREPEEFLRPSIIRCLRSIRSPTPASCIPPWREAEAFYDVAVSSTRPRNASVQSN